MMKLKAIRNLKWFTVRDNDGNPVLDDDGNNYKVINCEAQWEHLGDLWMPFTADKYDPEQHGKDLYAALINGDHGEIAAE
jgi:hypothetical protein